MWGGRLDERIGYDDHEEMIPTAMFYTISFIVCTFVVRIRHEVYTSVLLCVSLALASM
jgi:uncharacterized membrane protein required for colicin V production